MPRLTLFLAKLTGLYLLIVGVSIGLRKQESVATIDALVRAPDLLLVIALILLATGLALVLRHNVWSGGTLPVVITLLGWLILLRGVLLLILPAPAVAGLLEAIQFGRLFYAYVSIEILIGLYLTYAGFTSGAKGPAAEPT